MLNRFRKILSSSFGGDVDHKALEQDDVQEVDTSDGAGDTQPATLTDQAVLSPIAASDPLIAGLPDKFKSPKPAPNGEDFTFFHTIAQKLYLDIMIPGSCEKFIQRQQEAHAQRILSSRLFLSKKNEFDGYRRLIFMGRDFMGTEEDVILAVDEAGRLKGSRILQLDPDAPRGVKSIADIFELMHHGIEGWALEPYIPNYDLNSRTRSAISQNLSATEYLPVLRWERSIDKDKSIISVKGMRGERERFRDDIQRRLHRYQCQLTGILRASHKRRHGLVRWAIADALDPEILRSMRGTTRTNLRDCARICATGDLNVNSPITERDAELSKVRLQALRAFPILSERILRNDRYQKVIDAMEPLTPIIAEDFGVSSGDVRKIQGLTWQKAAISPRHPEMTVSTILSVPDRFLPSKRQEFRDLGLIRDFGRIIYDEDLQETLQRLGAGGSPYRFLDKLRSHPARDIDDAMNFLIEKLYIPAMAHRAMQYAQDRGLDLDTDYIATDAFKARLRTEFKPKELIDLSERYHRNILRFDDRITKINDGNAWAPFLGHVVLPKGIKALEINSSDRLTRQGRAEDHCVGGYTSRILRVRDSEAHLIFSIEDEAGILSTAEVHVRMETASQDEQEKAREEDPKQVLRATIVQNMAKSNRSPGEAATKAAESLIDCIEKQDAGVFQTYTKQIASHNDRLQELDGLPFWIRSAGYSPFIKAHLNDAWDELSSLLPRGLRKKGLDDFIASFDLKGVKFSITPGVDATNPWDAEHLAALKRSQGDIERAAEGVDDPECDKERAPEDGLAYDLAAE